MIKKIFTIIFILNTALSVQAFEDCIITSDGELTNIKVEDNTIVDIIPITTILNEKNTFILHPLKTGKTNICILKNNKNLIEFGVVVQDEETIVEESDGIDILTLDEPDEPIEIDEPPNEINNQGK